MGWQTQHRHAAAQCNPGQAGQAQVQYTSNSWGLKNGAIMNAHYQAQNGTPMTNMSNYGAGDLYPNCSTQVPNKMYSTTTTTNNTTTTKGQSGAG